jgi:hypothetical protein
MSLEDLAPSGERVSAREALAQIRARGLDQVESQDVEVYRLVMLPVEFKRLCLRLDRTLAEHWEQVRRDAEPEPAGLPFGEDLQPAADAARRSQWAPRDDIEFHPHRGDWAIEDEHQVPGRLKLVGGREFTVNGIRGRLRFHHAVRTIDGHVWLEAFDRDGRYRSISPDQGRRVHRTSRMGRLPSVAPRTRR